MQEFLRDEPRLEMYIVNNNNNNNNHNNDEIISPSIFFESDISQFI